MPLFIKYKIPMKWQRARKPESNHNQWLKFVLSSLATYTENVSIWWWIALKLSYFSLSFFILLNSSFLFFELSTDTNISNTVFFVRLFSFNSIFLNFWFLSHKISLEQNVQLLGCIQKIAAEELCFFFFEIPSANFLLFWILPESQSYSQTNQINSETWKNVQQTNKKVLCRNNYNRRL